jgi:hypothetical protein
MKIKNMDNVIVKKVYGINLIANIFHMKLKVV